MADRSDNMPLPVYLPSNEPYLGRQSVFAFDQVISMCLKANAEVAAHTHEIQLSDLQEAASQIIPQGIHLALTIRELVRQGYLFGALVLVRPLMERAATMSYLDENPDDVALWKKGWSYSDRPSLNKRLQAMSGKADTSSAKQLCDTFNSIVHGDPVGAQWSIVRLSDNRAGYSVSKTINEPELCDFICFQTYHYLIVLMSMMIACFPDAHLDKQ